MKYELKVLITITALIIIIPLNGVFLLRIFNNQDESGVLSQKKYQEIETNLSLIDEAVNIIEKRQPFSLTASNSGTINLIGKLKLQILNGSAIPGKANSLNEKLKVSNLFSDISLDNTDSTTSSALLSKKGIPEKTYQNIAALLKNEIPAFRENPLLDNDKYDVIIIIGANP